MIESVEPKPSRVFVGLKIDPDIAVQLAALATPLKDARARLVAPADIHLTLVPPWRETVIEQAVERLSNASSRFAPFSLRFDRIAYGPEPRRPHLLWVECAVTEDLASLQSALMTTFEQENARPFRPHLTLARIRDDGRRIVRTHPIDHALSLVQRIRTVELFRSPPPGTTGYHVVASAPLAGKQAT
jgi:RNA 2',3'-cyclic 3'-phosphodiesterase